MATVRKTKTNQDIELYADAWPRFERFIRDVAKAGPQHRTATKSKTIKSPVTRGTKKPRR